MPRIALSPSRPVFQPRHEIHVTVSIRNEGTAEIVLPNPAALRASPAWRLQPWSTDGHGRVFGNQMGFAPPPGQPEKLTLPPGADWSGPVWFDLGDLNPMAGDWALSLLLPLDGEVVESPPCKISIAEWSVAAGAAGHGVMPDALSRGDSLVLQAGPGPYTLCRMPWIEDDTDRTGPNMAPAVPLLEVAADATDLAVPTMDGPFWIDPLHWWIWREGASIHAADNILRRQRLDLPEPPACLLPTVLRRPQSDLTLAILAADRLSASIIHMSRDASVPPSIASNISFPGPAAAATLSYIPGGGPRLTAYLTVDGVAVIQLCVPGEGRREVKGPRAEAIPNGAVAIHTGPDGTVFAATLARDDDVLLLLEAEFPADPDDAPSVAVTRLDWPEDPPGVLLSTPFIPEGFTLVYGGEPEEPPAPGDDDDDEEATDDGEEAEDPYYPPPPRGLIELGDRRLLRLDPGRFLHWVELEGEPVRPFVAMPTTEGGALLCVSPLLGPFIAEL